MSGRFGTDCSCFFTASYRSRHANKITIADMKIVVVATVLACLVAFAAAGLVGDYVRKDWPPTPDGPIDYPPRPRVRREKKDPKGSLVIHATKPMSGPDRRPSLDIDYQRRILSGNGASANAYGGLNIRPGQPAQPHLGITAERNYRNGFIRGYGQVERGSHGRMSPTFGASAGFRFRRDVDDFEAQEEEY